MKGTLTGCGSSAHSPIIGHGVASYEARIGSGGKMADVVEALCAGNLVVHIDESAWCSNPSCITRENGDASVASKRHLDITSCTDYFSEGCPACQDLRVWSR
jgi:hypothetical protein